MSKFKNKMDHWSLKRSIIIFHANMGFISSYVRYIIAVRIYRLTARCQLVDVMRFTRGKWIFLISIANNCVWRYYVASRRCLRFLCSAPKLHGNAWIFMGFAEVVYVWFLWVIKNLLFNSYRCLNHLPLRQWRFQNVCTFRMMCWRSLIFLLPWMHIDMDYVINEICQ